MATQAQNMEVGGGANRREAESLVMYDTPILVSTQKKKETGLSAVKVGPSTQRAEDFLNSILPPKEFTDP